MTDETDGKILALVSDLLTAGRSEDARLVQQIWSERQKLVEMSQDIFVWDLGHSEALSLERVKDLIEAVLLSIDEI
jgi:hypothetical protein